MENETTAYKASDEAIKHQLEKICNLLNIKVDTNKAFNRMDDFLIQCNKIISRKNNHTQVELVYYPEAKKRIKILKQRDSLKKTKNESLNKISNMINKDDFEPDLKGQEKLNLLILHDYLYDKIKNNNNIEKNIKLNMYYDLISEFDSKYNIPTTYISELQTKVIKEANDKLRNTQVQTPNLQTKVTKEANDKLLNMEIQTSEKEIPNNKSVGSYSDNTFPETIDALNQNKPINKKLKQLEQEMDQEAVNQETTNKNENKGSEGKGERRKENYQEKKEENVYGKDNVNDVINLDNKDNKKEENVASKGKGNDAIENEDKNVEKPTNNEEKNKIENKNENKNNGGGKNVPSKDNGNAVIENLDGKAEENVKKPNLVKKRATTISSYCCGTLDNAKHNNNVKQILTAAELQHIYDSNRSLWEKTTDYVFGNNVTFKDIKKPKDNGASNRTDENGASNRKDEDGASNRTDEDVDIVNVEIEPSFLKNISNKFRTTFLGTKQEDIEEEGKQKIEDVLTRGYKGDDENIKSKIVTENGEAKIQNIFIEEIGSIEGPKKLKIKITSPVKSMAS